MSGAQWEEKTIASINRCQLGEAVAGAMPGQQQTEIRSSVVW